MITTSFRRTPESSKTNDPRSGQLGVASLRENVVDRLDSGLRRNDGLHWGDL